MRAPTGGSGFDHTSCKTVLKQRIVALELMATAALALSLAVALTAVSIGIARADCRGKGDDPALYWTLMPAALTIGHQRSISDS